MTIKFSDFIICNMVYLSPYQVSEKENMHTKSQPVTQAL